MDKLAKAIVESTNELFGPMAALDRMMMLEIATLETIKDTHIKGGRGYAGVIMPTNEFGETADIILDRSDALLNSEYCLKLSRLKQKAVLDFLPKIQAFLDEAATLSDEVENLLNKFK